MRIIAQLPAQRQTIMFSATLPPKIRELARKIMHDPEEVSIAVSKPNEAIEQSAYVCYENQKTEIVRQLFAEPKNTKTIVFASSKLKVKELAYTFKRMKLNAAAMHSDLEQERREEVMLDFRNGKIDILVATDIVARGIDIEDIGLVINYDVPRDPEDYIHRIGRTARASADGAAHHVRQRERAGCIPPHRNVHRPGGSQTPIARTGRGGSEILAGKRRPQVRIERPEPGPGPGTRQRPRPFAEKDRSSETGRRGRHDRRDDSGTKTLAQQTPPFPQAGKEGGIGCDTISSDKYRATGKFGRAIIFSGYTYFRYAYPCFRPLSPSAPPDVIPDHRRIPLCLARERPPVPKARRSAERRYPKPTIPHSDMPKHPNSFSISDRSAHGHTSHIAIGPASRKLQTHGDRYIRAYRDNRT